jgi:hypothetical protein
LTLNRTCTNWRTCDSISTAVRGRKQVVRAVEAVVPFNTGSQEEVEMLNCQECRPRQRVQGAPVLFSTLRHTKFTKLLPLWASQSGIDSCCR